MASKVTPPSPGVDPAVVPAKTNPPPPASKSQPTQARRAPIGPGESDVRLVIEKQGDTGRYVYTVLDKDTGRVITRIPSSDVLKLMSADGYTAGSLFKTRV